MQRSRCSLAHFAVDPALPDKHSDLVASSWCKLHRMLFWLLQHGWTPKKNLDLGSTAETSHKIKRVGNHGLNTVRWNCGKQPVQVLLLCAIERGRDRVGTPSIRVSICLPPEQPGVCLTLLVAVAFGFFFSSFSPPFQNSNMSKESWLVVCVHCKWLIGGFFRFVRAACFLVPFMYIGREKRRGERSVFFIKIYNMGFTL